VGSSQITLPSLRKLRFDVVRINSEIEAIPSFFVLMYFVRFGEVTSPLDDARDRLARDI
jgi:hypothetical protein